MSDSLGIEDFAALLTTYIDKIIANGAHQGKWLLKCLKYIPDAICFFCFFSDTVIASEQDKGYWLSSPDIPEYHFKYQHFFETDSLPRLKAEEKAIFL